jgi:enamine deaminase RidA (YjgF/YER057c/UK114 family)
MKPSKRLAELEITLPTVAAPIGSYVPAIRIGRLAYTSGQVPFRDGKIVWAGKVPDDVTLTNAVDGARISVLNAVAAIASVAGGVDNIARIVRVCVYVNSSPGFIEQPKVANGASDLLFHIFGDAGRHARSAVGVSDLPVNAVVEVEVIAELAEP